MAIKSDHRNLRTGPKPTTTRPGYIGVSLARALVELEAERGPLPMATGHARARHSWAGGCAKRIGYEVAGVEPSEPATDNPSALWSFALGRYGHELTQQVISRAWDGYATIDHEVGLDCGVRAGTADTVLTFPKPIPFPVDDRVLHPSKILFEYKTMGGFKFKKQVTEEGPARSAYLQGAMNAVAAGADVLVLCSLALDQMSPRVAETTYGPGFEVHERFWAEWWYSKDEFAADGIAEGLRLEQIVKLVDTDKLVPRHIPGEMPPNARIVDPSSSRWEVRVDDQVTEAGAVWGGQFCNYCPFQSHCVAEKAAGR